jgi:uncharacterized protein (TIGR02996 family)
MSIEDGFLAAIIDAPDDDTHRLIFADWLEDHRQIDRAEFIRLQIQFAGTRDQSLRKRIRVLLDAHAEEWAGDLIDLVDRVYFRRGFPERVTLTVADLLESGEQLFARAPVRETVVVRAQGPDLAALAACPHLARLATLDFRECTVSQEDVPVLFASPHLSRLETLVFRLSGLGDAVIQALAEARQPPKLKTLDLYDSGVTAAGVATLATCPGAASVERLILGNNHPWPEVSIVPLASSPYFGRLQTLHLAFTSLGDEDARALARSSTLGQLRSLDLRNCPISEAGAALLRERFGSIVQLGEINE